MFYIVSGVRGTAVVAAAVDGQTSPPIERNPSTTSVLRKAVSRGPGRKSARPETVASTDGEPPLAKSRRYGPSNAKYSRSFETGNCAPLAQSSNVPMSAVTRNKPRRMAVSAEGIGPAAVPPVFRAEAGVLGCRCVAVASGSKVGVVTGVGESGTGAGAAAVCAGAFPLACALANARAAASALAWDSSRAPASAKARASAAALA